MKTHEFACFYIEKNINFKILLSKAQKQSLKGIMAIFYTFTI